MLCFLSKDKMFKPIKRLYRTLYRTLSMSWSVSISLLCLKVTIFVNIDARIRQAEVIRRATRLYEVHLQAGLASYTR